MQKKYYLALDDYEHCVLLRALKDKRNELIANGKYTDAVDDVIIKVAKAPRKKFKIKNVED